ncbi:MAG TPA: hypothetical protein VGO80_16650 [Solirubrobacteraceae bacterium]|nr:hypothetical protein [Solirubrobacteraceae bacterium]
MEPSPERRRRPRERLLSLPLDSAFVFVTLRGHHYTPSTRIHHWNRVRAAAGLAHADLYTCTRHYFAGTPGMFSA